MRWFLYFVVCCFGLVLLNISFLFAGALMVARRVKVRHNKLI